MIKFEIKNLNGYFYDLTFYKIVHKRTGEIVEELGETHYGMPLYYLKYVVAHKDAQTRLKEKDVSFKEYLIEFNKSYNEVCELLKKIS